MRLPVALLLLAAAAVFGQAQSADTADVEAAPQSAPVKIDGVTLFRVRGISAFPAEKRAAAIADRIRALAADPSFSPSLLRFVEEPGFFSIRARDQMIMRVADSDAALESVKTQVLAQAIVGRIGEAIQEYRELRRPELLWRNAGKTLLLSALLAVAVYFLLRVYRRTELGVERFSRRGFEKARMDKLGIAESDRVWLTIRGGLRFVVGILILIAFLTYLNFVLGLFPWTRAISISAFELLLGPVRTLASGFLASLPNLTFLAVLFVIVRFLLKLTRLMFDAIGRQTIRLSGFDPEWAGPTYRIVRILIIAFGLIVAYPYLPGSGSEAFKGVSLFVGVIFSLGSSGAIANIIAGYSLTYRRAYRLGDRVRIGDVVGDVEYIRLQVTHLRSLKNEEIIIPNSLILNSNVINYTSLSKEKGLILHTTVGIGYETPWRQVEAMLLMAVSRTAGLLQDPPPFVLEKALGDFAVTYEVNAYCRESHRQPAIYAELHRHILDVFNEYGVQIMTPNYEGDPAEPKLVPKEKWYEAPAQNGGRTFSADQKP